MPNYNAIPELDIRILEPGKKMYGNISEENMIMLTSGGYHGKSTHIKNILKKKIKSGNASRLEQIFYDSLLQFIKDYD